MVSMVDTTTWAPLIGRFILEMGTIENATRQCLKSWTSEATYKHTKSLGLKDRIGFLSDLLNEQSFSAVNKAAFLEALERAKELLQTRNVVAHQPLQLMFFRDDRSPAMKEGLFPKEDETNSIDIEKLKGELAKAQKVASSLIESMAAFRLESVDFDYLRCLQESQSP